MDIRKTSALVTGGASGLGAATAKRLAEAGASVFAIDLPGSLDTAAQTDGVNYVAADVTNENEVRAAILAAEVGGPLRTVVNCAGIAPTARILGHRGVHDLGLFAKVVQVNLVGTFTVMALAAEAIARTNPNVNGQRGVVVNTASIAGYEGQIGQVAYASSKAGVIGLTLAAARDLASVGVRVCAVAPGIIDTPMLSSFGDEVRESLAAGVPFPHRLGLPDEFARLVATIIEHDYLNGETIRMDGALRMQPR